MIIGVTGRVGSGKTTLTDFVQRSYPTVQILDLDLIGHQVLSDMQVRKRLIATFGDHIVKEGAVDRPALGQIVFSNSEALKKLNEIVHPKIKEYVLSQVEKVGHSLIVGAVLVEIGLQPICDEMVVIDASDADIISHVGQHKARRRYSQRSREDFRRLADVILINNYTADFLNSCKNYFDLRL